MGSPYRPWVRVWVLAVVLATVVLIASAAGSAASPHRTGSARRAARVTAAVRGVMRHYEIPGVILGVWQRGQAPLVEALGGRAVSLQRGVRVGKMKTDLYMRIGSETKTFTGTAVLRRGTSSASAHSLSKP